MTHCNRWPNRWMTSPWSPASTTVSTDATADVMRVWGDRMGRDRFVPVRLAVNVGAPAARNWLMQLPQVAACEYTAYLDDDAAVPADWLRHFARAVALRPEAAAWGCRVVDWHSPGLVQSAALHMVPPSRDGRRGGRCRDRNG